ncbi:MAG TPA: CehA/McbA family metallohydrolase [Gemmataceae bacterium]|nr:CehA/McbA family metallohydrolase [Gemmataceae bacterium]
MRSFAKIFAAALFATLVAFACVTDSSRRPVTSPVIPREVAGSSTASTPYETPSEAAVAPATGITITSPYRPKAHIYRGQLHAHTTNSDGRQSPAAVMAAYRDHGFDFAAITDHDFNTPDPGVRGILFIPGVENDHTCLHENRIGATTVAPGARLSQDVIDQANREGSFVQINHPDWPGSYPKNPCWSDAALLAVRGYDAIEVWNNSNEWNNSNAEPRIDYLLSRGRRTNMTAVDDCHDVRAAYCMVASTDVFADALTLPDVIAALKSGNFYSSSGARITSITVHESVIEVTVPVPSRIEFIASGGKVVKTVPNARSASYAVDGSETYVRIRVRRDPGPRMAWSNPLYVTAPSGR